MRPLRIIAVYHSGASAPAHETVDFLRLQKHQVMEYIERQHPLPAELPPCDLVLQQGLDEPPQKGLELLAELRRRKPETPIVVYTGHGMAHIRRSVAEVAGTHFLHRRGSSDRELLELLQQLFPCNEAKSAA